MLLEVKQQVQVLFIVFNHLRISTKIIVVQKNIIMNERIRSLREESLKAINKISAERAVLLTRFYKSKKAQKVSLPVKRAMAFKYILEKSE